MMMTEEDLIKELAKAWNNLNVSFIENLLIDDFRYASQWVVEEMKGKDNYINFISTKFQKIRESIDLKGDKIIAEVGYCNQGFPNKPCIVLTQISGNEKRPTTLLIETDNGLIKRIDMCAIPAPETVNLTGLIPM
jgi:hypothetical protein